VASVPCREQLLVDNQNYTSHVQKQFCCKKFSYLVGTSHTFMSLKTTCEFRWNLVWRRGGRGEFREDRNSTDIQNVDTFVPHKALHPWNNLLTYLLTPWSRVLLEKLTSSQKVKKLPAFYGTQRFITAFTSARHLSLSQSRSNRPMPPHPTTWRSIISSSHLRLGLSSGLFPSGSLRHLACRIKFYLVIG
jgi:hypothetical protein